MTISPSASLRLITWETNQEVKRETTSDTRQGSSSVWVSGDSRGSRIASFICTLFDDLPVTHFRIGHELRFLRAACPFAFDEVDQDGTIRSDSPPPILEDQVR